MPRTWIAVAAAIGLVLGVGACAPAEPVSVGVLLPSRSERWVHDADLIREAVEEAGRSVEVRYAGGDIPTQVRQIRELVDRGADLLLVAPVDPTALTNQLEEAGREGVDVVAYGTLPLDTTAVDAYVTYDRLLAGRQLAWALLDGLGLTDAGGTPVAGAPTGPFAIELLAGPPGDVTAIALFNGAYDVLVPYLRDGRIVVPSGRTTFAAAALDRWAEDAAHDRIAQLLEETDVALDGVLSPDDRFSAGAVAALAEADAGPAVVTGRGAREGAIAAILDGDQHATLLIAPRELASRAAEAALALLDAGVPAATSLTDNGALQVPTLTVPAIPLFRENVRRVLVGGGYWTKERFTEVDS
jgi:putative multiple sugar transport system substrate-binding protein